MKINKENMKGLAEKLDVAKPPTLEEVGITKDDICIMAYQLQYFFEAMEEITKQHVKFSDQYSSKQFGEATFGVASGLFKAWDILNNALIDKGEIR